MTQTIGKLDLDRLRARARSDFYFLAKAVLQNDRLNERIHLPVCRELQDLSQKRKLVELPRGWYKTTLATIAFPIWLSINDPEIRILIVQNTYQNACKKLSVIGQHWENNALLRAMFPELLPNRNSRWSADAKCLSRNGAFPEATYEAAGANTAVVSRHYNVIIEDDTVAPELDELGNETLAPTHDQVQKAIGWHKLVLPLMDDPKNDVNVVIGTRWYDQDLLRYVKDNEPEYKVLTRAARETDGKPDPKGECTFPERFDLEVLKSLERSLGPYMYNCLYLNTPVRADDMLFKAEWFQLYESMPDPRHLMVYTTVDVATDPELAMSSDIDYNVVMTCGKDMSTGFIYVLDYFRKRCNPGELLSAMFDHVIRFRPICVGYDDTAYQRSIEYHAKEMMRQLNVWFKMEPIKRTGKDAKKKAIAALQPVFAAKSILLREHHKELQSELLKFPLGDHDDLADALSMQLALWKLTRTYSEQRRIDLAGEALNFDAAVASIKARRNRTHASAIFDPFRTPRELCN